MKLPHRYNSLALRLVLAAALWIGAALLVGGLILSAIFRDYAERTFDGYDRAVERGKLDAEGKAAANARLAAVAGITEAALDADMIIEEGHETS